MTIQPLVNDTDVDGDNLTVGAVGAAGHGTVVLSGDSVVYTPAPDFNGSDSFSYEVSDGQGEVVSGQVNVTVSEVNDLPVAMDDSVITDEDIPVTIQPLANDTDVDGDGLSIAQIGVAAHGTAVLAGNSVVYTPAPDFNGSDSFTYEVSDGRGGTAAAKVSVVVAALNDAPVAADTAVFVREDETFAGTLPASDVDSAALTYSIVEPAAMGTVTVTDSSLGLFLYTPEKDRSGSDSFRFMVSDGTLSATATVTVNIAPVNDAPVAWSDVAATESGKTVTVDVTANDSDVDGDLLSLSGLGAPVNGSAAIVDGRLEYTPTPTFVGEETLSYTVTDGHGGQAEGLVTITVTVPMQRITYSWEYDAAAKVAGFKAYRNGELLCQTSDATARSLTCTAPVVSGPVLFKVTAVAEDGTESDLADPMKYDETGPKSDEKLVSFHWDYDTAALPDFKSFRLYMNGALACETTDSKARSLSCPVLLGSGVAASFQMTVVDGRGNESRLSNTLTYDPGR